MIKNFLQKFFNFFGYKVSLNKKNKYKNFDNIIKRIFPKKNVKIIDIGANKGQTIERFKEMFEQPRLYSIEPTKKIFNDLKKKYDDKENIRTFNFAIGEKNSKKKFYNYKNSELNSFFEIKDKTQKKIEEVKIDVITLDYFCKKQKFNDIDILKIDTQGNEKSVLIGAKKSLQKKIFKLIEIEIILGDYYKVKNNFSDIEKYLTDNNYKLIAIDRIINFFSNKYMYFNAIYIREDIFNKLNLN